MKTRKVTFRWLAAALQLSVAMCLVMRASDSRSGPRWDWLQAQGDSKGRFAHQSASNPSPDRQGGGHDSASEAGAITIGIEWVTIPGGSFEMGSNDGEKDEKPIHTVTVSTFEMSKTEVTNAQYMKCVAAGACTVPHWDDGRCGRFVGDEWVKGPALPASFRGDDQPVVCVDWDQATAFARWAGARLPTEAEWEHAARSGGKNRKYPWGDEESTCARAVMDDGGRGCGRNSTWPVCSKPAGNTDQGLCDMAGNAAEWCSDWYGHKYYEGSSGDNPTGPASGRAHVDRGGSWFFDASWLRNACRGGFDPVKSFDDLGFRLARSVWLNEGE